MFDDVSRQAFRRYGIDMVKDEMLVGSAESPCFLLSLNADPHSFPDEVVKRSLMVYTTTALPSHKEHLRQQLQTSVQDIRKGMTGHLYRKYLLKMMDAIDQDPLLDDWLKASSKTIRDIMQESTTNQLPDWCRELTYLEYADKRYDRIRERLGSLFREATYVKTEGDSNSGWTLDSDSVIYWETRDAFGRSGI